MDLKDSSSSDGYGSLNLSDDVLLFLAKHYLKEQDNLSLAMSGASSLSGASFASLYTANRKRLAIGRNSYHLTPTSWAGFFKECISPVSIITFDASHAYWLPPEVLLDSIVQMTELEELCVHDTKISISHLQKIFENCPKLVKLTFTLQDIVAEDEMEKASLDLFKNGFAKLTHLKIFNFTPDDGDKRSFKPWLNLFQVLGWCRDCVDLVVKFAPADKSECGFFERTPEEDEMMDKIDENIFPRLLWMKNLKSLAIVNSSYSLYNPITMGYPVITELLEWLLPQHECLERLWISDHFEQVDEFYGDSSSSGPPFLKSLAYQPPLEQTEIQATIHGGYEGERFALMEHVADVPLQRFDHLPNLKYFRGRFDVGFNNFGRSVPKLEELHIDRDSLYSDDEELEDDWDLPLLKILDIFGRDFPKEFVPKMMKRCPNIEELIYCNPIKSFPEKIQFKQLKRLRIGLSNKINLPAIFGQCPKLESLHLIETRSLAKRFFHQLTLCFPIAANLRDLRLSWELCDDGDIHPLIHLMKALLKCTPTLKYFERLVLHGYSGGDEPVLNCAEFEELIVPFAKGMPHLVCLAIVGFPIDPSAAEVIKKRIAEEVMPIRPAFWFYLGKELPEENDDSVPRIHYEEIVNPVWESYIVPPDILNLK